MAFIFRRIILTLLVPFLWKKWRDRDRSSVRGSYPSPNA
jgi:hypothetical protein